MKAEYRYRLYILNPKTKKWYVSARAKKLKRIAKTMAFNLRMNPGWYSDDKGKRLKMRLVCEGLEDGEWREMEEYRLTKNWQIKGYFEWEKLKP